MKLETKWNLRQLAISLITLPLGCTTIVLVFCVSRTMKFHDYGINALPYQYLPKNWKVQDALHLFWIVSLAPLFKWFLLSIPADLCLRRFVFKVAR